LRIDAVSHFVNKDLWGSAAVFVSNATGGLNRAHATCLEYALVQRAQQVKQSHLENGNEPAAPSDVRAERADTQAFLRRQKLLIAKSVSDLI
jgi:hypothetical protein